VDLPLIDTASFRWQTTVYEVYVFACVSYIVMAMIMLMMHKGQKWQSLTYNCSNIKQLTKDAAFWRLSTRIADNIINNKTVIVNENKTV